MAIAMLGTRWCLLVLVLGTTADEYFCPALESLADWLGLRQRVAAVTLLALGNGGMLAVLQHGFMQNPRLCTTCLLALLSTLDR